MLVFDNVGFNGGKGKGDPRENNEMCDCVYVHLCKERERKGLNLATSTTLLGLNSSTLTNSDSRFGLLLLHGATNLVLDLLSHCQESLFDIRRVFGGSLQEWYAQRISKFLIIKIKSI